VVVEATVLDGDDGLREVLAETSETDGFATLGDRDLIYLITFYVLDVGVLGKLGVGPVEVILVIPHDEKVEATNAYPDGYTEDQGEVEEGA